MDFLNVLGNIRYGVPTSQKESLARSGSLPGAPEDTTAEQKAADRYAAGFLFALQHPEIASTIQPLVDRLKTSDLPLFGGASPELQSYASEGVTRGADLARQGMTLADLIGD